MEVAKRRRAFYRRQVKVLEKELSELLEQELVDYDGARARLLRMKEAARKISEYNEQIIEGMLDRDEPEEDVDSEQEGIGEYRDLIYRINAYTNRHLEGSSSSTEEIETRNGSTVGKSVPMKFPKLEIRKFCGKLEDWPPWWAQFKSIHESTALNKVEKFQYLVQSLVEGTRAADVVKVYHCTEENYDKAIQALKERCGNEDAITDMLMREIVQLVTSRQKLSLTKLYDQLEGKLHSLESMGRKTKTDCDILYPMVEASFSEDLLRTWKRVQDRYKSDSEHNGESLTKLELLMQFLKEEAQREDEITLTLANVKASSQDRKRKIETIEEESVPTAAGLSTAARVVTSSFKKPTNTTCVFCDKPHQSKDCYTARKLSFEEKKQTLVKAKCCFLCFRKNHLSFQCRDKGRCQACLGRHHVLMCSKANNQRKSKTNIGGNQTPEKKEAITRTVTNCFSGSSLSECLKEVPLQTVKVKVSGPDGTEKVVRAVLDPGAQKSALLKSTASALKLPTSHTVLLGHCLYSGKQTKFTQHKVHRAEVRSLDDSFAMELNLIDEDTIVVGVPTVKQNTIPIELRMLQVNLTDCDTSDQIELLLANDVYGKLLTGKIQNTDSGLTAIETKYGWVLSGECDAGPSKQIITTSMMSTLSVQQLWDLESIGIRDPIEKKSKKDLEEDIKSHFLQTLRVNEEGRYQVQLPWVMPKLNVSNNWSQAVKRLMTTTKRLKDNGHYQAYQEVFMEWYKEGVIEVVPSDEVNQQLAHYLPHRAVIKTESTTKVRPVFDASCRLAKSLSLNDCLAKGPNLLELIPDILLRFRLRAVGAIADIRKAFLMISVDPLDRDYLRFLWWENDEATIKVYRHRRVVFGVNCSPFQLAAVIEHHLCRDSSNVAKQLLSSYYVDNCVVSLNSIKEYQTFKSSAVKIMARAKMDLRLWESNHGVEKSSEDVISNVLGLTWDRQLDTLTPSIIKIDQPDIVTKRAILAISHSLFDPLGVFTPISLEPKLCLREACVAKLSWDEQVPQLLSRRFRRWCEDLKKLSVVKIPRRIADVAPEEGVWTLHVFTDASQEAYAAVGFIRVKYRQNVTVRVIQSKARLAPVKATIPRLELLACLIGARLASVIKGSSKTDWKTTFWSDSMTALTWIRRHDSWGTFVNNRVEEIRKLTNVRDWRHVPGAVNPADLPSRGCSIKKFIETEWWTGPRWLLLEEADWPREETFLDESTVAREKRKSACVGITATEQPWNLPTNSYLRNIRVMAWILRWKRKHNSGFTLEPHELTEAEKSIWRIVQRETNTDKTVQGLALVRNQDGIWCVKLKITMRDDIETFLMPVVLPKDHPIVEQLIMSSHLQNLHAGPQTVVMKIREKVWIRNSKKIVHKTLSRCVVCRRYGGKPYNCITPPLPKERVNDARVFQTTGVDLGGPLFLRDGSKAYFALFTCAVYRAIHLELLLSLSTEAFLQAFRRFIARRGRPEIMYSDRGTNFKGLDNLMNELDWKKVKAETCTLRIQWRFNPATAPWWGGWWERLVGLVKRIMRRIFGKGKLNREELETSLCDIEAIINSRPLTYVSEDPGELLPLTPAMFMSDAISFNVPDLDEIEATKFEKRYRYRQKLKEELRSRFRSEYLANLIQHSNKLTPKEVRVGEIVLVGSDNVKRMNWPLARVVEKIPGRDGICRLVKLRTSTGEMLRPIQRVFPLEVETLPIDVEVSNPVMNLGGNEEQNLTEGPVVSNEDQRNKIPTVQTRSGRVIKAPQRLSYMLAGWKLIE